MAWRLVKSLEKYREQINTLAPGRSKASDGSIGDAAHAAGSSDHNPESDGTVDAIDVTHDPAHGADMHQYAEALRASRDSRIKYVIFDRRIFSSTTSPWAWRPYSGPSPHEEHMHISVNDSNQDDTRPWAMPSAAPTPEVDLDFNQAQKLDAVFNASATVSLDTDAVADGSGPRGTFQVPLTAKLNALAAAIAECNAAVVRVADRVAALPTAPAAGPAALSAADVDAVASAVADKLRARLES